LNIAMISEHASPLAADGAARGLGGADGGGQNVHVAALARALARRGHTVTVYTRRDSRDVPARVPLGPGVIVEHVPAGPPRPVPKDDLLGHMAAFGNYLAGRWRREQPDLVHAHFWMSGLAVLTARSGLPVPMVQTFHALGVVKRRHQGDQDTSPRVRARLEQAVGRSAQSVIATCSDELFELIRMGIPRANITIVPCGVDLDTFSPDGPAWPRGPGAGPGRQPARHRVLALSRLVERKGVDTAIQAIADVPGAELLVAGGPPQPGLPADPEFRRLQQVAADAVVAHRVTFLGQVPHAEVPALLRSVDLAVSLPWYEPFGMVPVEAMACGVPVVASAVGGHIDTVRDDITGVHVPPRDPAAIAGQIARLLADPARRAALGAAAAARARSRYSWDRVAGETEQVYQRTVRGNQTPGLIAAGGAG
jgi:glycosyltransferase involved in cell wall biosynthesis